MPIVWVISWLINHIDIDKRLVKDENGKAIASLHPSNLELSYKFPKAKST